MNIVVLCGGLSPERDVSISTGSGAARALRQRGHRVVLLDLYLGYEGDYSDPKSLFTTENTDNIYSVREEEPDLNAIRSRRKDTRGLLGPGVLEICKAADFTFLALHGAEGENGKLQACLDLYDIPYTGSGYLGRHSL